MTAEPARVISVRNLWAWRIVAGLKAVEERRWKPLWRGVLCIHASKWLIDLPPRLSTSETPRG